MENTGGYLVQYKGHEFVVQYGESPVLLVVHPRALEDDDSRGVSVISTRDTESGTETYQLCLPDRNDGEDEMWQNAISVAVIFVSQESEDK